MYLKDLQKMRELAGLTQSDFSDRMAVSLRTIQNWEATQKVPDKYMTRLSRILKPKLQSYAGNDDVRYFLLRIEGLLMSSGDFMTAEELEKEAERKYSDSRIYYDRIFRICMSDEKFVEKNQDRFYKCFRYYVRYYLFENSNEAIDVISKRTNIDKGTLLRTQSAEIPVTPELMEKLDINDEQFIISCREFMPLILEEYRLEEFRNRKEDYKNTSLLDQGNSALQVGDNASQQFYINKAGNTFIEFPESGYYQMLTPLVTQKAMMGYLAGWGDEDYISTLPQFPIVVKEPHKGKYMTFEGKGDSMDGGTPDEAIQDGDFITGRKVERHLWQNNMLHIKKDKPDFIIHTLNDGITVKRIVEHNVEEGYIICRSLNENKETYPDFKVPVAEISQIFSVVQVTKPRR